MEAKLIVVGGDAKAAEIDLNLPTIIGRGRDATLTLPHPLISRQHCELYESADRLFVRDLGSLNGTYVNNERIQGDHELPSGQLLTIGTVTFRAIYGPDAAKRASANGDSKTAEVQQNTVVPPTAATVQVADTTPSEFGENNADAETGEVSRADDDTDSTNNETLISMLKNAD